MDRNLWARESRDICPKELKGSVHRGLWNTLNTISHQWNAKQSRDLLLSLQLEKWSFNIILLYGYSTIWLSIHQLIPVMICIRIWRNWRPMYYNRSLRWTSRPVKNGLFLKMSNMVTLWPSKSTSWNLPKRNKNMCTHRGIHMDVDSNIIDNNSQRKKWHSGFLCIIGMGYRKTQCNMLSFELMLRRGGQFRELSNDRRHAVSSGMKILQS